MNKTVRYSTDSGSPDFGPKKITVNAVAPGGVKSDMYLENARHYIPSSDSMNNNEIDEVSHTFEAISIHVLLTSSLSAWPTRAP